MRSVILLISLLLLRFISQAQTAIQPILKIGYADQYYIYSNLPEYKVVNNEVEVSAAKYQSIITSRLQAKSSMEGVVKLNFLTLRMETFCNAELSGSTNIAHAELFARSIFNSKNLIINNLSLIGETLCKAEVNVSKQLTAKLFVESTLNNVGNAKSDITYPSMDQMVSTKSFAKNVDLYRFN